MTHFIVASIDSFKFSSFVESIKMFKSFATSSSISIWEKVVDVVDEFSLFIKTLFSFTSIDSFLLFLFEFFESFEEIFRMNLSRLSANRFSLVDKTICTWIDIVEYTCYMFIELTHIIVDWCFFVTHMQVLWIARKRFLSEFIAFVCETYFH